MYRSLSRRIVFSLIPALCSSASLFAQGVSDAKSGFEFLPEGLHFTPLKANPQEARLGVFKYFGTANLKVDIGNSIDILGFVIHDQNLRFTAGIDFMAYAFVTGAQGLRLQIDALDGFFGGNLTASKGFGVNRLIGRLRVLHLSAHMVDGHYSASLNQWLGRDPIPFTKDFGELTAAFELRSESIIARFYGGASYATFVRPVTLLRWNSLAGMEIVSNKLFGRVLNKPTNVFLANHFAVNGSRVYTGNNQLQFGVKFGPWQGKGVALYVSYYRGNSFFSEYFDERVVILGSGFTVDFP